MTILVTGATGTVGRHLVAELLRKGQQVRALTRDPLAARLPDEVEVVQGDLTQLESLTAAFEGVTAAHMINFGGSEGLTYYPLTNGEEIVDVAKRAGVRQLTMLMGGRTGTIEDAIQNSGLEWTFLQPVQFMANTLGWAKSIRAEGVVREPYAHITSTIVHEADIAAVAAAVLTTDGHHEQTYTLTGPQMLTRPERVSAISEAIGREIRYIELTEEEAKEKWRSEGYPPEIVDFFVWIFSNPPQLGRSVSPAIEQVTGFPPRTFSQWAHENAQAFRAPGLTQRSQLVRAAGSRD